jgi:hypothetical protein
MSDFHANERERRAAQNATRKKLNEIEAINLE